MGGLADHETRKTSITRATPSVIVARSRHCAKHNSAYVSCHNILDAPNGNRNPDSAFAKPASAHLTTYMLSGRDMQCIRLIVHHSRLELPKYYYLHLTRTNPIGVIGRMLERESGVRFSSQLGFNFFSFS